jgi:hypothetical protein
VAYAPQISHTVIRAKWLSASAKKPWFEICLLAVMPKIISGEKHSGQAKQMGVAGVVLLTPPTI